MSRKSGHCWCGKPSDRPGKTRCQHCVDVLLERGRRLRSAARCQCGRRLDVQGLVCSVCRLHRFEAVKKRRDAGLCTCGRKLERAGCKLCAACLQKAKDRRRRNHKRGYCDFCGSKRDKVGCPVCRKRGRELTTRRRRTRLCIKCSRKLDEGQRSTCDDCRAENRERERRRRLQSREMGVCPECCTRKARGGKLCSRCRKKNAEFMRGKRARLAEKGLCTSCGAETDGKHVRCDQCRRRAREKIAVQRVSGRCYYCNRTLAPDSICMCEKHKRMFKRRVKRRRRQGLCVMCGKPQRKSDYLCNRCRRTIDRRRQARLDAGQCINCGQHRDSRSRSLCRRCLERYRLLRRKSHGSRPWNPKHRSGVRPLTVDAQMIVEAGPSMFPFEDLQESAERLKPLRRDGRNLLV